MKYTEATLYRCPVCQTVFCLTERDRQARFKVFSGLWCVNYHGVDRPSLEMLATPVTIVLE